MKMFRPHGNAQSDVDRSHDQSWDRRFMAPYAGQRFNFTGVVIDKIPYPNHHTQVIIASIRDLSHLDFDIDHVSVRLSEKQADILPIFNPITFSAVVHPYPTTEKIYLNDIHRYVPAQLTNYTLDHLINIVVTATSQIQVTALSMYCQNRLKMVAKQTDANAAALQRDLAATPNDGTRERKLAPYVAKLQRPVNRISLHHRLRKN